MSKPKPRHIKLLDLVDGWDVGSRAEMRHRIFRWLLSSNVAGILGMRPMFRNRFYFVLLCLCLCVVMSICWELSASFNYGCADLRCQSLRVCLCLFVCAWKRYYLTRCVVSLLHWTLIVPYQARCLYWCSAKRINQFLPRHEWKGKGNTQCR